VECVQELGSLRGAAHLLVLGVDGDLVEPCVAVEAAQVVAGVVVDLSTVADEPDRAGEDLLLAGAGSRDLGLLVLQGGELTGELLLLLAGDVGGYDASMALSAHL